MHWEVWGETAQWIKCLQHKRVGWSSEPQSPQKTRQVLSTPEAELGVARATWALRETPGVNFRLIYTPVHSCIQTHTHAYACHIHAKNLLKGNVHASSILPLRSCFSFCLVFRTGPSFDFFIFLSCFGGRVSCRHGWFWTWQGCSWRWPWTSEILVSTSQVLRSQVRATMPIILCWKSNPGLCVVTSALYQLSCSPSQLSTPFLRVSQPCWLLCSYSNVNGPSSRLLPFCWRKGLPLYPDHAAH